MSVKQENRFKKMIQTRGQEKTDKSREMEAAFMSRNKRHAVATPAPDASRSRVRRWMRENASEYDCMTSLVEAANCEFCLPYGALEDETHWVWDEAFDAF